MASHVFQNLLVSLCYNVKGCFHIIRFASDKLRGYYAITSLTSIFLYAYITVGRLINWKSGGLVDKLLSIDIMSLPNHSV